MTRLIVNVERTDYSGQHRLNKDEQRVYNDLKQSFTKINTHKQGKIKLQNAKKAISEIEESINA